MMQAIMLSLPNLLQSIAALIATHDDDDARIVDSFTTLPACGNAGFDYHPIFITTHPVCAQCVVTLALIITHDASITASIVT